MALINPNLLLNNLTGYLEARFQLMKIELQEEAAKALNVLLVAIVVAFSVFMVVVLLSIGLASGLNSWWGTAFAGYGTVAGLYLAIAIGVRLYTASEVGKVKLQQFTANIIGLEKPSVEIAQATMEGNPNLSNEKTENY